MSSHLPHLLQPSALPYDRTMDDLAMDRPTAGELLEIIAETLTDVVVPATASHARHHARVAANLCHILARELADTMTVEAAAAVDHADSLLAIDDDAAAAAYGEVLALVRAKLDVVKPGYDDHGAIEEQNIVA